MAHPLFMAVWIAALFGCEGRAEIGDTPDLADTIDMADVPDVRVVFDFGNEPDPLCVGVTCMPNAECGRGTCWCSAGFQGDPNTGCVPGNPCDAVSCMFGATCRDDGSCPCDPGWEENLGQCDPVVDEFPLDRTQEGVCARWNADYPETAGVIWQTLPADECDGGELDPAYQLDAVRRVSLYRWLVGLPAVTTTPANLQQAQACASALAAEGLGGVTNEITDEFRCYSDAARDGAAGSSVMFGARSPAFAVDTFVEDAAAARLGNRRWILNPRMSATGFGFRDSFACMYAIDAEGVANPQYVAFPFGVFPQQALRGRWMWASSNLFASDNSTVTVMNAAGDIVEVQNLEFHPQAIFPSALAWEVPSASPGEYTVTIQGLNGAEQTVTYPVNIVTCP